MREIKFRAFCHSIKTMVYVKKIDFNHEIIAGTKNDDEDDIEMIIAHFKEVTLMQYTGLKDKNGKEIYEGDIFKYISNPYKNIPHLSQECEGEKFIVKFGEFFVEWDCIDGGDYYHGYYGEKINEKGEDYPLTKDDEDIEIIGTIYENPELIKD